MPLQHDDDSGEALEPDGAAAAVAPAATQQGSRRHAAAADVDSSGSEDWEELGSRPGLGFAGAAAARFAAVSLDEALEGALGSDMRLDSNNSFDSDASSSSSSSDYSDSGSSSDEDAPEQLDLSSLDASTAVVVDAQGRPMAVWESLTLQQRFPVQARAGDAGTGAGSSRRRRQQQGRQAPSRSSSGRTGAAGMLPADLPADSPAFECEVTAAAAKAAYAAALAAADVDAVQRQQRRQQQKSLAKGARHGQLLPGEKKRLRKEKIAAKRCERHGQQGQGALALLAAVERFALGGGDMEVLPPCGKHKQVGGGAAPAAVFKLEMLLLCLVCTRARETACKHCTSAFMVCSKQLSCYVSEKDGQSTCMPSYSTRVVVILSLIHLLALLH